MIKISWTTELLGGGYPDLSGPTTKKTLFCVSSLIEEIYSFIHLFKSETICYHNCKDVLSSALFRVLLREKKIYLLEDV